MKIRRYTKMLVKMFNNFGFNAFRVCIWILFKNIYRGKVKKVFCKNIQKSVNIRVGSTDVILLLLMFCVDCDENGRQEYDIDLEDRKVEYIIDAGANIGLFALLYAYKYPHAKIVCVEPDKDNYRILKMNTVDNPNIITINKGVWSKKTCLQIIDRHTGNWGYMVKEVDESLQEGYLLDAITISDILVQCSLPRIDILKLDIEGSEYEVFSEGCDKWIEDVIIVFIETHDGIVSGCNQRTSEVMKKYGFEEQEANGENRIFFKIN